MDSDAMGYARQQVQDAERRAREAIDPHLQKEWSKVAEMWRSRLAVLEAQAAAGPTPPQA
jgi:hypothetical protein